MNEHSASRRGVKNHRDSILADTKNLLYMLNPAIQRMPKLERIEGAPVEMKRAAHAIIRHFTVAKVCEEVRSEHIRAMIGEFGVLIANFELMLIRGLLTEKAQLVMATQIERIEEGIMKWRNAVRSAKRMKVLRRLVNDGWSRLTEWRTDGLALRLTPTAHLRDG